MLKPSRCYARRCTHVEGARFVDDAEVAVCRAYPNGIPDDIAYGDDKHLELRGDETNKVKYEVKR